MIHLQNGESQFATRGKSYDSAFKLDALDVISQQVVHSALSEEALQLRNKTPKRKVWAKPGQTMGPDPVTASSVRKGRFWPESATPNKSKVTLTDWSSRDWLYLGMVFLETRSCNFFQDQPKLGAWHAAQSSICVNEGAPLNSIDSLNTRERP